MNFYGFNGGLKFRDRELLELGVGTSPKGGWRPQKLHPLWGLWGRLGTKVDESKSQRVEEGALLE